MAKALPLWVLPGLTAALCIVLVMILTLAVPSETPSSALLTTSLASLEELVYDSSLIVVARYVGLEGRWMVYETPEPGHGADPGPLGLEAPLVDTGLIVDTVLKAHGSVTVSQRITVSVEGVVPTGTSEIEQDSESEHPLIWPTNTTFLLFLGSLAGGVFPENGYYYVTWLPCGRMVETNGEATCADGVRSVPQWAEGMTWTELVEVVEAAIESPQPTPTWAPYP